MAEHFEAKVVKPPAEVHTNAPDEPERFDPWAPGFDQGSGAVYHDLIVHCPVHFRREPAPFFSVSRHADVCEVLRNHDTWSSEAGPGLSYARPELKGVLVSTDPPAHTFERRLITKAFRPSAIGAMEPDVVTLVDGLMDRFVGRGHGDLVADLAMALPLTVMARLFGTPPGDVDSLRPHVLAMARGVGNPAGRNTADVTAAYEHVFGYFTPFIERRRNLLAASPEAAPDDLLTRLLTAELDGVTLTEQDVLFFIQFLLVAGSATTTLLITNLVRRLLDHPDQLAAVRADRTLVEPAIEESLRLDAPVHGLYRTPVHDTALHGVQIPADAKVMALFAAANRDPAVFSDPDRFDAHRDPAELRAHLAFGYGIHFCLGAPLARLEAKVALNAILDRLPNLRAAGEFVWLDAMVLHGFEQLPLAWDPA
jgi:cytochrome P450